MKSYLDKDHLNSAFLVQGLPLQCEYIDQYGRLDVVEEEELRSSPNENVVSD